MTRIALIGDHNAERVAHRAIPIALRAAATELGVALTYDWIHSSALPSEGSSQLETYDAIWCVPGSPYQNPRGILNAIRFARLAPRPFLGTCGGFQHALLEYAEQAWQIPATHAESEPQAADALIAPLMCPLVGVSEQVRFEPGTLLHRIYGVDAAVEEYQCSFGLNPRYRERLEHGPMRIAARDERGDVRAVELVEHPFFVGTLFQFERGALAGRTPVVAKAFVAAAASRDGAILPGSRPRIR